MTSPSVWAAGAVVLRRAKSGPEVLVMHRPRYDDWSLPKGKLERGETDAVTAAREVVEETGVRVRLTAPLSAHRYEVGEGLKQVDWWLAEAVGGAVGDIGDTHEVDKARWQPVATAANLLTYADERDRLTEALDLPRVTPLLIVRHAKALARKHWEADDVERPITAWGRRQSRALVSFLNAFGVRRVVTSSAQRCRQTVSPYARAADLPLDCRQELTEVNGQKHPELVQRALADLAAETARTATPTVVCGHRPVLPEMLAGIGLSCQSFATAETLVAALNSEGKPVVGRALLQRVGR